MFGDEEYALSIKVRPSYRNLATLMLTSPIGFYINLCTCNLLLHSESVRDLIPQGGIKVYKRRKYKGKLGNEVGMHIVRSTKPNKLAESTSEGASEALGGDSVT